jgi:hypothetical protein
LHTDLLFAKTHVYDACGFSLTDLESEPESAEYAAHTFRLNNKPVRFRIAKITPTKTGQFVTIWKRNGKGPIMPFDLSDELDFIIISVRKEEQLGQFIFPKTVLNKHDIVSGNGKKGKRGIRVYPPWDQVTSKQAQKTQDWQMNHFLWIEPGSKTNLSKAGKLLA